MQRQSRGIIRVQCSSVSPGYKAIPITHNDIDDVYIFYTPDGRLVQSTSYEEAEAKWLLTKETD